MTRNEQRRQRRARKRASGVCTKCSEPAVGGGTLCAVHRDANRQLARGRHDTAANFVPTVSEIEEWLP